MCEKGFLKEVFYLLHTIIKLSGVRVPSEYWCIIDNAKLQVDFIEEAIADFEDTLCDLE